MDHEKKAASLDDEATELEHESKELGKRIDDTREDWERKKADDNVPGAGGDPAGDSGPPPEVRQPG